MSVFSITAKRICPRKKIRSYSDPLHFQMYDSDMVFSQKLDKIPVKLNQILSTGLKQYISFLLLPAKKNQNMYETGLATLVLH
jgi:hypothetical protein